MSATRTRPILDYLAHWAPRVEAELDRLLPSAESDPRSVHEAMRYSVFAGGKRLRPALVLLGARAAGGGEEDVLGTACAVEFVHTYSLIHDDLPAMDDDDLRRGRPSCHRKFGDAVAILAGDALNTFAFQVLSETAPLPRRVPAMIAELCAAAGTSGMVGGQVADLESEGERPAVDRVRAIHTRKTGALLTASLRLGALAVGAHPALLGKLRGVGEPLGLAFQIVDDVLDEEGAADEIGKTPGKDRAQRKLTYPAAVGVADSRAHAGALVAQAAELLGDGPADELLLSLGEYLLSRRS